MNITRRLPAALRVILDAVGLAVLLASLAGFFYILDALWTS
jgi:hypothetical protein